MKNFGTCWYANMMMPFDELQHSLLTKLIAEKQHTLCIETGTYLGLGSTTNLAKAFIESGVDLNKVRLYTFEANHENYYKARENLKRYNFVHPLMGSSMSIADIKQFIENDDALIHPENYPDVYIDGDGDCRPGYISESIGAGLIRPPEWNDMALLPYYLLKFHDVNPLLVLDSAGGLGLLEFNTVMQYMENENFSLLLDDTEHVKHFRSMIAIKSNPKFTVLGERNGWALMTYVGNQ